MQGLERFDDAVLSVTAPVQDVQRAVRVFNGTYTITMPNGSHRTFRIHTKRPTAKFAPGQRVVSLLIGADNERDYKPFAFIDDMGIRVWKKHRGTQLDLYAAMLWTITTHDTPPPGHSMTMAGTCLRCNRLLTDPESIARGVGPFCWEQGGKSR